MQKTDNRTNGGRFENEFAEILARHGFWAHVMQQNKAGQPSDIIAVKGKFHTLIDAKVISDHEGFPFSRIEENQALAMSMFTRRSGEMCYFALKLPDESIHLVSFSRLMTLKNRGKKRITEAEIQNETWPLKQWLDSSDTWSDDV